jgi:hypothetical protein
MQTLGIETPPPRSDGRIKSLLWPAVANDTDVDSLTTQGFWICVIVGALTLATSLISGNYLGSLDAIFFYLAGNGVRQRSRMAAVCVFAVYALGTVLIVRNSYAGGSSGGMVRFVFCALLLANVRAIWMASKWRRAGSADESPAPLSDTITDQIADRLPALVWPKTRWIFYLFAVLELAGVSIGLFGSSRIG